MQISSLSLEHNHDCHEDDFARYPINRKLDDLQKATVAFAMNGKAKPAKLVNQVQTNFGKFVPKW